MCVVYVCMWWWCLCVCGVLRCMDAAVCCSGVTWAQMYGRLLLRFVIANTQERVSFQKETLFKVTFGKATCLRKSLFSKIHVRWDDLVEWLLLLLVFTKRLSDRLVIFLLVNLDFFSKVSSTVKVHFELCGKMSVENFLAVYFHLRIQLSSWMCTQQNFSKVSTTVILHTQIVRALHFEKFQESLLFCVWQKQNDSERNTSAVQKKSDF